MDLIWYTTNLWYLFDSSHSRNRLGSFHFLNRSRFNAASLGIFTTIHCLPCRKKGRIWKGYICILYLLRRWLLLLYASNSSSGLFIFGMGVVIGVGAGGNSFPIVLATIGRRFPRNSKYQSIAFGIVSSFGSLGQCCFLPIARATIASIGWRMSFIVSGNNTSNCIFCKF